MHIFWADLGDKQTSALACEIVLAYQCMSAKNVSESPAAQQRSLSTSAVTDRLESISNVTLDGVLENIDEGAHQREIYVFVEDGWHRAPVHQQNPEREEMRLAVSETQKFPEYLSVRF